MDIIANKTTIFDSLVGDSAEGAVEMVAKNAERLDAAIYARMDHSRFVVAARRPHHGDVPGRGRIQKEGPSADGREIHRVRRQRQKET